MGQKVPKSTRSDGDNPQKRGSKPLTSGHIPSRRHNPPQRNRNCPKMRFEAVLSRDRNERKVILLRLRIRRRAIRLDRRHIFTLTMRILLPHQLHPPRPRRIRPPNRHLPSTPVLTPGPPPNLVKYAPSLQHLQRRHGQQPPGGNGRTSVLRGEYR